MESQSQANQDNFVLKILEYPKSGYFIDIGCNKPIVGNNTKLLEDFGWNGLAFDLIEYENFSSIRKCKFIEGDCTKYDYNFIFKLENVPSIIEYLSLDIDEQSTTVLKKISLDNFKFKVITIEHDFYIHGDKYQKEQREILYSFGYDLICSNVATYDIDANHVHFEDWWINPNYVNISKYEHIRCDKILHNEIINKF